MSVWFSRCWYWFIRVRSLRQTTVRGRSLTMSRTLVLLFAALVTFVQSAPSPVRVRLQDGWVRGVIGTAENRTVFASFLGVPYAKQPIRERRFSELEPLEPWDGYYDASTEGPICPQHDPLYGPLLSSSNMDEACIYANIHVPLHALPDYNTLRPVRQLRPPYETTLNVKEQGAPGLPILVYIHGGGFAFGSGGIGLHGPEYLINRDIIVITFNYRLNVMGFLSLNSTSIPGNNGLRDMVTLLKWVQANAKSFGGDPDNVTLGGQSAGASCAHLLSLSRAAEGLFKRVILMSGTGIPSFFTTSPAYAKLVADLFLAGVGINATDPEDIHRQLIAMPIEKIMEVNKQIQEKFGLVAFNPVVETSVPGFTTILDNDPEILLSQGFGKNIPLLIGFTNAECEIFRPVFEKIDILSGLKENPFLILSPNLIYKLPPEAVVEAAQKVQKRYFDEEPTMDKYIHSCSDTYYVYPAIRLTSKRAVMEGAPVFLYQYSYEADFSVIKESKGLQFKGAGHIEDESFIFRANVMEGTKGFSPRTRRDQSMIDQMTMFVKNFISCNNPTCDEGHPWTWPAAKDHLPVQYQNIERPGSYSFKKQTKDQQEMVQFFESLQNGFS